MRKRREREFEEICKRFLNKTECCAYTGLGLSAMHKAMLEIGAVKKVGKRCLYDRKIIDDYFDTHDSISLTDPVSETK